MYDFIKNSNSSLKRRPKKLLQDSIEKILLVLKEEQGDSDSMDGNFDGIEDDTPRLKVREPRKFGDWEAVTVEYLTLIGT